MANKVKLICANEECDSHYNRDYSFSVSLTVSGDFEVEDPKEVGLEYYTCNFCHEEGALLECHDASTST